MGLQVQQVTPDDDFQELSVVERVSFENPTNRLLELYFPLYVHGTPVTSEAVRTACINEAATRQIAWLQADPTATWIKVVDDATGEILGGALWHVDATGMGRLLCENHGFQAGPRCAFEIEKLRPLSERLEGVSGMFVPFEWWPMWRAPGGEKGEANKAPWHS